MEILGLDPKITICKIAVLPVKLYPLFIITYCSYNIDNPPGVWTQDITVKASCLNLLTSGSNIIKINIYLYIRETTWTFTIINQRSLSSPCLPIPALGHVMNIGFGYITLHEILLRLEWLEHSSELSWAACFTY